MRRFKNYKVLTCQVMNYCINIPETRNNKILYVYNKILVAVHSQYFISYFITTTKRIKHVKIHT